MSTSSRFKEIRPRDDGTPGPGTYNDHNIVNKRNWTKPTSKFSLDNKQKQGIFYHEEKMRPHSPGPKYNPSYHYNYTHSPKKILGSK